MARKKQTQDDDVKPSRMRVQLVINLDVTGIRQGLLSGDVLSVAHQRAEQFAMRVLLCGDAGGKMNINVEQGAISVEPSASQITTMPGNMKVSRWR